MRPPGAAGSSLRNCFATNANETERLGQYGLLFLKWLWHSAFSYGSSYQFKMLASLIIHGAKGGR